MEVFGPLKSLKIISSKIWVAGNFWDFSIINHMYLCLLVFIPLIPNPIYHNVDVLKRHIVPIKMVEKNEEIASGQFGYVYKGTKANLRKFSNAGSI